MPGSEMFLSQTAQPGTMFQGVDPTVPTGFGPQTGLLGLLAQPLVAGVMQSYGYFPGQFFPQNNAFDLLRAESQRQQLMTLTTQAAQTDVSSWLSTTGGLARMAGLPWGLDQQAGFRAAYEKMSPLMSIMAQIAPQMVDSLHGPKGSAAVLAQGLFRGSQYMADTETGLPGMSTEAIRGLQQTIEEQLYGDPASIAEMMGVGMGELGLIYDESARRGYLPGSRGARSRERQTAELLFSEDGPSVDELLQMDDVQISSALRDLDSKTIASKLKSMTASLTAVKDLLGSNGEPDAPISQLINTLEALTQNRLASMDPGAVQTIVRRAKAVTEITGIGLDGLMSLTAGAAAYGDTLGVARPLAIDVGQMSALTGAGYKQAFGGSYTAFDAMSAEEVMKREVALRTRAAGSEQARFAGALIRTVESLGLGEETEAGQLASALRAGELSFDDKSMYDVLSRNNLQEIVARSGADAAGLQSFQTAMDDTFGNQENINRYGLGNLVRQLQPIELVRRMGAIAGENSIQSALVANGMDVQQAAQLAAKVAPSLLQTLLDTESPEALSTAAGRQALITSTLESQMGEQGRDIAGAVALSFESMMNEQAKQAGLGDLGKLLQNQNKTVIQQTNRSSRVASAEAELSQLLAPLGRGGPIRRVIKMLQEGGEDTQIQDLMGTALNGIKLEDVRRLTQQQTVLRNIAGQDTVSDEDRKAAAAARADIEQIVGNINDVAEKNGLDIGRSVTDDDFKRLTQSADDVHEATEFDKVERMAQKRGWRIDTGKPKKIGERLEQALANQFARANNLVQALYTDDKSLRQLGPGGIDQLKGIEAKYLRMLRVTGGDMELVSKALSGDESVPEELRNEIQNLQSSMTTEIADVRKQMTGGSAMSDKEWETEKARIDAFRASRTGDDTQQTNDMLSRLETISGTELSDGETTDLRGTLGEVASPRRKDIMLAIEARERLAQIATERGQTISEVATDDSLRDLVAQAGSLATLGQDADDLEDATSLKQALEKFAAAEKPEKGKEPLKVDLTGTIKMIDRDQGIFAGSGYTTEEG